MTNDLLDFPSPGTLVKVTVCEPWDFVTQLLTQLHTASFESRTWQAADIRWTVQLHEPIAIKDTSFDSFDLSPRHVGDSFRGKHGKVFCNGKAHNKTDGVEAGIIADIEW